MKQHANSLNSRSKFAVEIESNFSKLYISFPSNCGTFPSLPRRESAPAFAWILNQRSFHKQATCTAKRLTHLNGGMPTGTKQGYAKRSWTGFRSWKVFTFDLQNNLPDKFNLSGFGQFLFWHIGNTFNNFFCVVLDTGTSKY